MWCHAEEKPRHQTEVIVKKGTIWMSLGLLLIIAALFLTGYNLWDEKRAENESAQIVDLMEEEMNLDDNSDNEPDYAISPDMEMPIVNIDGQYYIGTIEIPIFGLKLPVMEEWSYPKLKIAPCRYKGSAYSDDLIIAAHNYSRHFGQLKNLLAGDEIIFTDVDGNQFVYEVAALETLEKTDVEKMESGEWDLTLFTCTYGGRTRVTVRCVEKVVKVAKR